MRSGRTVALTGFILAITAVALGLAATCVMGGWTVFVALWAAPPDVLTAYVHLDSIVGAVAVGVPGLPALVLALIGLVSAARQPRGVTPSARQPALGFSIAALCMCALCLVAVLAAAPSWSVPISVI